MTLTKEEIIETPYKELKDESIKGRGTFGRWSLEQYKRVIMYLKWLSEEFNKIFYSREQTKSLFELAGIKIEDVETDDCRELLKLAEELMDKIKSDVSVREDLLHEFVNSTRAKACRGESCD